LAEPIPLQNGTTVIDIGFVDFGVIIDSIQTLDPDGETLTVLAYEMEPLCVAKTWIMLEMMQNEDTPSRSVVEVWLSSLWSRDTLRLFHAAATNLLRGDALEPRVRAIIAWWNKQPRMSRSSAIKYQFEQGRSGCCSFIMTACAFTSETDRVDFLRYYRTRALYEDSASLGSITMCTANERIGISQHFGNVLEACPPAVYSSYGGAGSSSRAIDFDLQGKELFAKIRTHFEMQVTAFADLVRRGTLKFLPKLGCISLEHESVIRAVAATEPYFISWSNISDYMDPQTFHSIAKRMSGPDTVHYMHSCNWTQRVYGTDVYDVNSKVRLHHFAAGLLIVENYHGWLLEGLAKKQGVYHFRDLCTLTLGRRFVKAYLRYFFEGQDVNCGCMNGNTPMKPPTPFSRTTSTAYWVFSYKTSGVTFGMDAYDLAGSEN
jgi:hypothetical protein